MKIKIKRIYEASVKSDGKRILADRLWPRGIKKEDANIDLWVKELAPSNELRKWFHVDPEKRFAEFSKRYKKELNAQKLRAKDVLSSKKTVTLVTAVKNIKHSHIPTLQKFLQSLVRS